MSWHKADNDLLSEGTVHLLAGLPGLPGLAALGLLGALRSRCSIRRSTDIPLAEVEMVGRLAKVSGPQMARLLRALIEAGYLEGVDGAGYRLLEESVVRPSAPSRSETGKAARMRRYRANKKASPDASTVDAPPSTQASTGRLRETSTEETGRRLQGVSLGDGGASTGASTVDTPAPSLSPPDPPPAPAPTPAQAQAQAHAGGAPAAAPVSHFSTTNEASSEPPPSATRPKAKAKKPSPKRTLPARAQLAAAYAAGVSAVTGSPCSPPTERWALDDLEALLSTHAPGLVGAEALGWLTQAAKDFADAKAEDRFTADKGFPPKMARSWLDGGNRPAPRDHGPRPPPPGPKVRPGPGPSHNWLADDEPPPRRPAPAPADASDDPVAELTRDLFAFPADLLAPEVPS